MKLVQNTHLASARRIIAHSDNVLDVVSDIFTSIAVLASYLMSSRTSSVFIVIWIMIRNISLCYEMHKCTGNICRNYTDHYSSNVQRNVVHETDIILIFHHL